MTRGNETEEEDVDHKGSASAKKSRIRIQGDLSAFGLRLAYLLCARLVGWQGKVRLVGPMRETGRSRGSRSMSIGANVHVLLGLDIHHAVDLYHTKVYMFLRGERRTLQYLSCRPMHRTDGEWCRGHG